MNADLTAIVLAGGLSRRLGRNKALEPVGGEVLVNRVLRRVGEVADETLLVVANLDQADALPLPPSTSIVTDAYPDSGSLGGIYTGLRAASSGWGLVVACDMPFLNVALLQRMIELRPGFDVIVPELDGRPEPTHALYAKACLDNIRPRLEAGQFKIAGFFEDVRVRTVSQVEVVEYDPDRLSFFNVNTQADLERAEALARE